MVNSLSWAKNNQRGLTYGQTPSCSFVRVQPPASTQLNETAREEGGSREQPHQKFAVKLGRSASEWKTHNKR